MRNEPKPKILEEHLLKLGENFDVKDQKSDAVVVLGLTGHGKSTFINYMIGVDLEKDEEGRHESDFSLKVAATETYPSASIGSRVGTSETLYPRLYRTKPELVEDQKASTFCDLPGFEETRPLEEKICAKIGTRVALKSLNVRSLMVVIDVNSLVTTRGLDFKKMSKILADILQDPQRHASSILFAFTKIDSGKKDWLLKMIRKHIEDAKRGLKEARNKGFQEDGETQNREAIINIFGMMVSNPDNIILMNGVDLLKDDQIRKEVSARIDRMPGIPSDQFKLLQKDDFQLDFDKFIFKKAAAARSDLRKIIWEIPELIKLREIEIKEQTARLQFYQKSLNRLVSPGAQDDQDSPEEEWIVERNTRIRNLEQQIEEITQLNFEGAGEIKVLEARKRLFDNDDTPHKDWVDGFNAHPFGGDALEYLRGKPILEVKDELKPKYGRLVCDEKTSNLSLGRYRAIVEWDAMSIARFFSDMLSGLKIPSNECRAVIYIAKKNSDENLQASANLQNQIQGNRNIIAINEERIQQMREEIKTLQTDVERGKENLIKQLETSIKSCERDIDSCRREMNNCGDASDIIKVRLSGDKSLYDIIVKIQPHLYEGNQLVIEFVESYTAFCGEIAALEIRLGVDEEKPIFVSNSSSNSSSSSSSSSSSMPSSLLISPHTVLGRIPRTVPVSENKPVVSTSNSSSSSSSSSIVASIAPAQRLSDFPFRLKGQTPARTATHELQPKSNGLGSGR